MSNQKKERIIAIIPARGGSKSIPGKNIRLLGGKPLIAYPITLARSIKQIDKVVVSTDDKRIAGIAGRYGAEVPFIRPKELAKDNTPTLPVLQHCIGFLEKQKGYKADIILLLYPTSPLLKRERVIEAINLFGDNRDEDKQEPKKKGYKGYKRCNSVISVVEDYGRFWSYSRSKGKYSVLYPKKRVNRQYYKPLLKENGAIYFSGYDVIMKKNKVIDEKNLRFLVMEPDEVVDIDTPEDWGNAEKRIRRIKMQERGLKRLMQKKGFGKGNSK